MDKTLELIKELTEAHGVPGYETPVRAIIRQHLGGLGELSQDKLGSVICKKKGTEDAPRVMGTETSALAINPLTPDDAGDYECVYHDMRTSYLYITAPFSLEVTPASIFSVRNALLAAALVCLVLGCFYLRKRKPA